jgi:hypothetical protein
MPMIAEKHDALSKAKEDSVGSLLNDLQSVTMDLFKESSKLNSHADLLFGGTPSAGEKPDEQVAAAQTVIQKLRDLRRQLRDVNSKLYETGNRFDDQF